MTQPTSAAACLKPWRATLLRLVPLLLLLPLAGCVSTVVGVAAGTVVAVGAAVVTAPVKIGAAVIDAASDDDEDED